MAGHRPSEQPADPNRGSVDLDSIAVASVSHLEAKAGSKT